jgi:hypothetical protein
MVAVTLPFADNRVVLPIDTPSFFDSCIGGRCLRRTWARGKAGPQETPARHIIHEGRGHERGQRDVVPGHQRRQFRGLGWCVPN